ncbi:MAG: NAD(P)/FAD-dependent oxidoreductase [Candidatus Marinarcus sp.]|uniref:NAD(P)/FAD-dependent oxidoreductase n=1 Tax=Candidatus Marinarcus sp. TaxID=3100987 RepID=UPI003B00F1EC
MLFDVAIIGAGASGLMAAALLKDKNVCLIDANATIGAKIKVSGGAKCNITNKYLSVHNYVGDPHFIEPILNAFDHHALLNFLKTNGVEPKIHEKIVKGTYFCNSSNDVIAMFSRLTQHATTFLNTTVTDVEFNEHYCIKSEHKTIEAKKLIVASGGLSYPSLGASCIAYEIAKKFGHTIKTLSPALVGFTVQREQFWFKNLSGISLDAQIQVENKVYEGSLLFAHKGCSGPLILNASLAWKKGKMVLDFLPNKKVETFLKGNRHISSALPLPKRFSLEFLQAIKVEDKPVSQLSKEELTRLHTLKHYEFSPAGNFGYTKAEVTKGGIHTDEIEGKTLQSLFQKDLYFLGECLDVTGELGGYNFQFAFASAVVCTQKI